MPVSVPEEVRCAIEKAGGLKRLRRELPRKSALKEVVAVARGIADETRLRILSLLKDRALCVCVLKSVLGTSDSNLSYHLSILARSKLISRKKDHKFIICSITKTGKGILRTVVLD